MGLIILSGWLIDEIMHGKQLAQCQTHRETQYLVQEEDNMDNSDDGDGGATTTSDVEGLGDSRTSP